MNTKQLALLALTTLSSLTAAQAAQIHTFESDASGFNTKTFFYDNGEEVIAFDSQFTPKLAEESIKFLRTKTNSPISHLVITHPNPDKFNGINVFRNSGAKVVASQLTVNAMDGVHAYKKYFFVEMAKMFTNDNYPALNKPEVIFEKELTLKLRNGDMIILSELGRPGVSTNQTVAFIPKLKSLIVGDLIHHKAHAWLEGGIKDGKPTPTIESWVSLLKELGSRFKTNTKVFGGRGQSVKLKEAVSAQIKYLKAMNRLVIDYVKALEGKQPDFVEIQKSAEKLFPDYQFGYMVQYGIYGLVNSK